MNHLDLQQRCELGQRQLMGMQYLAAERTLAEAADEAWVCRDFDTLARVYMPLQEARRQIRQRAGEGIVCLDLLAESEDRQPDARKTALEIPHGQILIAGWKGIEPGIELRRLQKGRSQYAETLLGAVFPVGKGRVVRILPLADGSNEAIELKIEELSKGRQRGTAQSYGLVSSLWEKLHRPFLARADAEKDPIRRIEGYLKAIQVDYACEFAHQRLAEVAKGLAIS